VASRSDNPDEPHRPDAAALLRAFVAVLQAGARFPTNSPRLLDPCQDLLRVVRLNLAQRERLSIRASAEGLRIGPDGTLFARSLPDVAWVLGRLESAGLEGVDVTPGAAPELLAELAGALRKTAAPGALAFDRIWGAGGPGVETWERGTAPDVRPWGPPLSDETVRSFGGRRTGQPKGLAPRLPRSRAGAEVRPRPLLSTAPSIAPRDGAASPPRAETTDARHSNAAPVGLADQLTRESRVRNALGQIRFRFEREYADRELLDIDEMLRELLAALPHDELSTAESAATRVAEALERVVDRLEDFLRAGPSKPGQALQELALAQLPPARRPEATRGEPGPDFCTDQRTSPGDRASPEADAGRDTDLVAAFPDSLPAWLDDADPGDGRAATELRGAVQRVGEGAFLVGTLRLVSQGTLMTPPRVERLLTLAGVAAAPIAAILATQGATWTRGLVLAFLRRQELPPPECEIIELLDVSELPPSYLADLAGSIGATEVPESLSRASLDVLRGFCEDLSEDPIGQERRLAALSIVGRVRCPQAANLLEHLSRAGQFVDRSPSARRFRAAAAAALRRRSG
jgi:hypothetical protein